MRVLVTCDLQPFGGKADHLAQKNGVWGLLHKVAEGHHLGGPLGPGGRKQPDAGRPMGDQAGLI
ncbi:hypothetical protein FBT96_17240 [Rhodobacter capsulatus]|uniref:Uncharacterized protein n=1 Tax=Rhodobacter capsulatus TaxID=1061 RepID=A0A4U1JLZ7_RHOCA|nr:hypothetical protein [Rhodobacter capsulatus]TKD15367.1 hypothetical protein FBT96_17240 [Rhodobacter capsulatus]